VHRVQAGFSLSVHFRQMAAHLGIHPVDELEGWCPGSRPQHWKTDPACDAGRRQSQCYRVKADPDYPSCGNGETDFNRRLDYKNYGVP
jgi:hypothetical protein